MPIGLNRATGLSLQGPLRKKKKLEDEEEVKAAFKTQQEELRIKTERDTDIANTQADKTKQREPVIFGEDGKPTFVLTAAGKYISVRGESKAVVDNLINTQAPLIAQQQKQELIEQSNQRAEIAQQVGQTTPEQQALSETRLQDTPNITSGFRVLKGLEKAATFGTAGAIAGTATGPFAPIATPVLAGAGAVGGFAFGVYTTKIAADR